MYYTISQGQMSDLFFNHEHPFLDALRGGVDDDGLSTDEIAKAIALDASEFVLYFDSPAGLAVWLADDFMRRM